MHRVAWKPKLGHTLSSLSESLFAEAEVGLEEIMDRLGHIEDATTRNIYYHVIEELKKRGFSQVWTTHEKPTLIFTMLAKC